MTHRFWRLFLHCVFTVAISMTVHAESLRFAAIGDTPYFSDEISNLEKTLALMADVEIPFVVHIGDIFSGGEDCSAERYQVRANVFHNTPMPFLITIGDNEYNDCPEPRTARQLFRKIILNSPSSHQIVHGSGSSFTPIHVTRQVGLIENASWSYKNTDFIMLMLPALPGGSALTRDEINAMLEMNTLFLVKGFKNAKLNNRDSVVVMMHSDPSECHAYQCSDFNARLKDEVRRFNKPVLLINGSDHDREFVDTGYQGLNHWAHLRPGNEPAAWWPEVTFSTDTQKYSVTWRDTPYW